MRTLGRGHATAIAMCAVITVASLLGLQPATAAQKSAALYHYPSPGFTGSCSTGGSGTSSLSTVETQRRGTKLFVTVQLIGAAPNTTYTVITQAPICGNPPPDEPTIGTDANGDGSVQYQQPVPAGTDTVIVSVTQPGSPICTPSACSVPSYLEYRSAELNI